MIGNRNFFISGILSKDDVNRTQLIKRSLNTNGPGGTSEMKVFNDTKKKLVVGTGQRSVLIPLH